MRSIMLVIDYGEEVDFDPTSFVQPVALADSAVATVKQVVVFTGIPSASVIDKVITFGE